MNIKISEAVREAKIMLEPVAQEESLQQAKIFVATIAGIDVGALSIHADMILLDEQLSDLGDMVKRRLTGEPVQYILGEWEFYGLPFYVDERVLIPRQDTELLVETAIQMIRERGYHTCLDLCTGSGCVAISIAKLAGIAVTATDISRDALSLAQENADLNAVQINLAESDLFAAISAKYDLITCNPPYLSQADMDTLQKEVSFEPALALFGGEDGLDYYRRIAQTYEAHLNPGGTLLLEIGSTQADAVAALFTARTGVLKDLGGNDRLLVIEP